MSSLKNRREQQEIITSSDFDEEDVSLDDDMKELQDETSEDDSEGEKTQLIKVNGNGVVRNHLRSSQSFSHDEVDGDGSNDVTNLKNGYVRNGTVYIPIPAEISADDGLPVKDVSDVHRYPIKDKSHPSRKKLKPYPHEYTKVAVAALFVMCNFIATATSLAIVHEYYPLMAPLPDHILDSLPYQSWGLKVCEMMLSFHTAIAIIVIIFHKHRFIVVRRIFLILGLLYGYRAITMFVTVLPRADSTYYCSPKLLEEGKALTFFIIAERVFKILSGFGLSMNGQHTYCGDYIFSGHTMMFVLTYLVVQEYTSRRFFLFHWAMWLSGFLGVGFLLWSRGHYTIDCLIAYYVATRIWYMYHSMACHASLKKATSINYFTRLWWWSIFRWFEENVRSGPLPNGFSLPFSRKFCKCLRSKSRELVNETSRLTRINRLKMSSKQEA